ncbi:MAG: molybdate ABC transporter substrate-binding protein [Gemmobacter sp.]|uniref:molybdate ABC transporter substrate-binding protein n=1 Tax=Gemmobacter sp. TaxID=1898957 RepID=UPI001A483784|nr:molybdate ABC transporter substrate-binding protein [Gemmobacter sp.]MBL8563970.1 molybdate ABC transporter substrate-binding protein [Gemmobacter sp.]
MSRKLALALMLTGTPLAAQAEEVVVFAAASLKTALDQIAADWQAETGHQVTLSYGGSNKLAAQILQGAPADIFISASPKWMDEVEAGGDVVPGSRADLLGNQLVLIGAPEAAPVTLAPGLALTGLLAGGKLSMATVDAVPAGQYGKAALESLGLWEAAAPQVAQSEDVRAALRLVAVGEAPFGIVYASDAVAEPGVKVVGTFPADSHPKITYPAALLTGASDAADQAFLAALSGEKADAIFVKQGFSLP